MNNWYKVAIVVGSLLVLTLLFRVICVYFVDNYELGYSYNKTSGEITELSRTGYFIVNPITTVIHTIDLRPMQVRIEANNRVLNAKLVQFDVRGFDQFISLHGRGDYNNTYDISLSNILMCYAYENYGNTNSDSIIESKYHFIKILSNTNTANK